jgi:hypothetical protein
MDGAGVVFGLLFGMVVLLLLAFGVLRLILGPGPKGPGKPLSPEERIAFLAELSYLDSAARHDQRLDRLDADHRHHDGHDHGARHDDIFY